MTNPNEPSLKVNATSKTPRLVTTAAEVKAIAAKLREKKIISLDTEFIRENTFYPQIALIQVATDEETWLLDPTALSQADLQPALDVMTDPNILKVMHAAHSDQECFYTAYGMLVAPVIDTSVGAALCGMGDNLGLGRLLKELVDVHLPKGRARARWLARPLSKELLDYAEQDVAHLVRMGEALIEKLKAKARFEWALEESIVESSAFDMTPEELARKMSKSGQMDPTQFPILLELVRWREKRARDADLPRGWVADNETLLALSKSRPASTEELRSFRGLNGREVEKSGKEILAAIGRGKAVPRESIPKLPRPAIPSERENHILDLIQTYVAFLAADLEIASRFLLSSHRTFQLLQHSEHPEKWVELGIISPHAFKLVGQELVELLGGKRALALRNSRSKFCSYEGIR